MGTAAHEFCMKHAVNASLRTGLLRLLLVLAVMVGGFAHESFAATVRWEVLPDRDRVTVSLSPEEGFAGGVTRVEPKGLLLDLGVATAGMRQELAPEDARFFKMSEPRGRALGFFMKTEAFDFLVTRPDQHTVIINAFADPDGARWTPGGADTVAHDTEALAGSDEPAGLRHYAAAQPTEAPGVTRGTLAGAQADAASSARESERQETSAMPPPSASSGEPSSPTAPPDPAPGGHGPEVTPTTRIRRPGDSAATDPTIFRSRINPGSPGDWVEMHPELFSTYPGASSPLPPHLKGEDGSGGRTLEDLARDVRKDEGARPEPPRAATPPVEVKQPEAGQAATQPPDGNVQPRKIYVDAEGKEVPPPPDVATVLAEVQRDMAGHQYKDALAKVESLLLHPELTREQTEEILHLYAEMLFMANQNDLLGHFDAIVSASVTAMNYNQDSPRNPAVYLRLGYINLKLGNALEANAYFNRLRRQYPLDENVPLTYYYWGEYYYGRNEMQRAADEFQFIVSNYPASRYARDAAIGLARSYVALGYFQEAFDIIDYIERRWPRLYLEAPSILELMGDVGYRLGKLDFALEKYLLYYNLMPSGPTADVILTRIGDVFARQRQLAAAKAAYSEAERLFPDRDGGLVAMMRLAETGINDVPEVQAMLPVFQGTQNFKTADIYRKIITEHPESELVPLAQLKLAMWYFANKRYEEALEQCTDLVKRFPDHELVPRAEEVAMKAFAALAAEGALHNRPGQVLSSWEDNPLVRKQQESLPLESRVALAHSMWMRNDPDGALAMVSPMFLGAKVSTYSEQALLLALNINLDFDRWDAIDKLSEHVALWELTPKVKLQLDYAVALAKENLGRNEEAIPIWRRLAQTGELDQKQQAYAEYFLARDAENARRLQDAYIYGRSALNRFLQLAQDNPEQEDSGKINSLLASLMDICETSGRYKEALEFALQYMDRLAPHDTQRQGLLFRIAGIHRKQGNTPEWRKTLTELAEKYPDSVHGRAAASTLRSSQLAEDAARFAPGGQL